jgi:nucleoid-associated protein YgaU
MPAKSLFDRAIDALSTRDELAAAEQAKKVAQDALVRVEYEKVAREAAEARATKAESELARVLGNFDATRDATAQANQLATELNNLNSALATARNDLAQAQAKIASISADKDEQIADLMKQLEALKNQIAEENKIYTVKAGDSLSKIAKAVYGDWNHWKDIYEANKDQIKDPDKIRVGWELKLPKIG